MNKEKTYLELIDLWSSIYKKKMGDLFSLEELKQEAWLAVLEVEKRIRECEEEIAKIREEEIGELYIPYIIDSFVEDRSAYISKGIKNKILTLLLQEIKHRTVPGADTEIIEVNIPDEILTAKQFYDKLRRRVENIPHATFVLAHMNLRTTRDISSLAKEEGVVLSKSEILNLINKIRKEFDKLSLDRKWWQSTKWKE